MTTARRIASRGFLLFFTGILSILIIFPFYWMAISSVRTNSEIFSTNIDIIPQSIKWQNYQDLFSRTLFLRWILNSVLVSASTMLLGLLFCTLAGFSFAKYRFWGRDVLFLLIFLMISIPRFVTIIPIFKLMSNFSLTDTYFALILPFAVNPFAVFLMRQYIKSVPEDLLDSARIDGLNELNLVFQIVLPVIKPALGAAGIFILMTSWNDYLFPLIMMNSDTMVLFPVGLASLKTLYLVEYGMIMAGSFLSTLPLIIGFLLLQKQFIAGLTEGSIKS